LLVESIDGSLVAQTKARRLADARRVAMDLTLADLTSWEWPERKFDLVVAIFIQFAPPTLRTELFAGIVRALKPEGLLMLQGYRPEQLQYGTGGPSSLENLYCCVMGSPASNCLPFRHTTRSFMRGPATTECRH
jgi:hypothetical protein